MLGERGLWFKMSFFEGAARVPLMIAAPEMAPGVVTAPVSTIDVCPTLCDLAGISMAEVMPWTHGESLVPLAAGGARGQAVAMEYAAEASYAPLVSLCSGWWKYNRCKSGSLISCLIWMETRMSCDQPCRGLSRTCKGTLTQA